MTPLKSGSECLETLTALKNRFNGSFAFGQLLSARFSIPNLLCYSPRHL